MKREQLTKTFIVISNLKNYSDLLIYIKIFQGFKSPLYFMYIRRFPASFTLNEMQLKLIHLFQVDAQIIGRPRWLIHIDWGL